MRVRVCPLEWKRAALVGLDWIYAAEVVQCQIGTRPVRMAFEHEALAVWREFRLLLDEIGLAHAEIGGDTGNLGI